MFKILLKPWDFAPNPTGDTSPDPKTAHMRGFILKFSPSGDGLSFFQKATQGVGQSPVFLFFMR